MRLSRLPGHGLLGFSITLMTLALACATTPPSEQAPKNAKANAATDPTRATETRSLAPGTTSVDPSASKQDSLDLARTILEREGARSLNAEEREAVARTLARAESEDGFPVLLSLAIIKQESRFDPAARGPAGSIGLMQLQPATARELARRQGLEWKAHRTLLDPEKNVQLGLAYLGEMRSKFGTTEHAIAAYNIGPGGLRRLLSRHPLRRGPYLTKVYGHAEALRKEYANAE
jgi:soluble lytic murein transglycosylase-like protein